MLDKPHKSRTRNASALTRHGNDATGVAPSVKRKPGLKVRTGLRHGLYWSLAAAGLGLALFAFSVPADGIQVPIPEKGFCYTGCP